MPLKTVCISVTFPLPGGKVPHLVSGILDKQSSTCVGLPSSVGNSEVIRLQCQVPSCDAHIGTPHLVQTLQCSMVNLQLESLSQQIISERLYCPLHNWKATGLRFSPSFLRSTAPRPNPEASGCKFKGLQECEEGTHCRLLPSGS